MSPSKHQLISRIAVVVLPVLLACAFFFIGRKLYMDQLKASVATRRAASMLSEISYFNSALQEARIRRYEFLLRKGPASLLRYIAKRSNVDVHLALLFCLANTNQFQGPQLAKLAPVVQQQLREMDQTVGLLSPEEGPAAAVSSNAETISIASKQTASILSRMRDDQTQLLFDRRQDLDQKMMSRMLIWTILCYGDGPDSGWPIDFANPSIAKHYHYLRLDSARKLQRRVDANGGLPLETISSKGLAWNFGGSI
jgi:CHASE3 domain sensor protein